MTSPSSPEPLRRLPRPGQKVRWRNHHPFRPCGWEAVFGQGPFEVIRVVDRSHRGLGAGLVVSTRLGEREIPAVWLALADEPGNGDGSSQPAAG